MNKITLEKMLWWIDQDIAYWLELGEKFFEDDEGESETNLLILRAIRKWLTEKKEREENPWFCPECGEEYNDCCKEHIKRLEKPRVSMKQLTDIVAWCFQKGGTMPNLAEYCRTELGIEVEEESDE